MSYILDALRKADAERERGAVPSLHTLPVLTESLDPPSRSGSNLPLLGALLAGVVLLGAGLAWFTWWRSEDARAQAVHVAGAQRPPPPPASPAPAAPPPAPAAPAPAPGAALALPAAPAAPAMAAPPPRPQPPAPQQPARPAAPPSGGNLVAVAPPKAATAVPAVPTPAPAPASAAGSDAPAPPRERLPEELKRALPPINVGGAMYAPEASQRMLVVNGQVVREGQLVAPDLVLERVKLRSAVLRFRGQRFEVSY